MTEDIEIAEKTDDKKVSDVSTEPFYISYEKKEEKEGGVLFMQFTLCIIILLFAFATGIVKDGFEAELFDSFRNLSSAKTEEVYIRAADAIVSYIYD